MLGKGFRFAAALTLSVALIGCENLAQSSSLTPGEQYSGFLEDYSLLGPTVAQDSFAVKRWISPKLLSGEYKQVEYTTTQYFPDVRANENVSHQLLTDVLIYVDSQLRLASSFISQDMRKTGTKVARIRTAITAVETAQKDYEDHETVSQALLAAAENTSINPNNDDAVIAFELEVRDAETNELLAQSVVTGVAPTYKVDGTEKLSLALLKPTIDQWIRFATQRAKAPKIKVIM
ncbi:DUF3313 domain-containing protein [Litoribrevibacter albus]|uniref:DUF3313 domain-containing protein n=1 Tax=Litoribrevibacter albus TaxID=1473156 RepID=A0AA37SEI0_9GAMM|nr:DUF3313 domain-containing protein [Litoribrevibacter albus]GLQ33093.1 hypothetical protein GCM10007876_35720 [Litoribrevibacter albus]